MAVSQKLSPRHRQIILMSALGKTQAEICRELGISQSWLSLMLNLPNVKLSIEKLQKDIEGEAVATHVDRLQTLVPRALDRIEDLMDNGVPQDAVRLGAAKDILDRTIPKRTFHEEEQTVRLVLEGQNLAALAKVIAEDDDREVELDERAYARVDTTKKVVGPVVAKLPEDLE